MECESKKGQRNVALYDHIDQVLEYQVPANADS